MQTRGEVFASNVNCGTRETGPKELDKNGNRVKNLKWKVQVAESKTLGGARPRKRIRDRPGQRKITEGKRRKDNVVVVAIGSAGRVWPRSSSVARFENETKKEKRKKKKKKRKK